MGRGGGGEGRGGEGRGGRGEEGRLVRVKVQQNHLFK